MPFHGTGRPATADQRSALRSNHPLSGSAFLNDPGATWINHSVSSVNNPLKQDARARDPSPGRHLENKS